MKKSSKLTKEEVVHVAKLAGLTLTPQEVKKFQKQLSEVLNYVEILKRVETAGVEPTSQVTGLENAFREDEVKMTLSQEKALSQTKDKIEGMFETKAVF